MGRFFIISLKILRSFYRETVTIQNIDLVKVIADRNLLLVKGAIPGGKGSLVKVRKAIKGQK